MRVRIKSDRIRKVEAIVNSAIKIRRRIAECEDISDRSYCLMDGVVDAIGDDLIKLKEGGGNG